MNLKGLTIFIHYRRISVIAIKKNEGKFAQGTEKLHLLWADFRYSWTVIAGFNCSMNVIFSWPLFLLPPFSCRAVFNVYFCWLGLRSESLCFLFWLVAFHFGYLLRNSACALCLELFPPTRNSVLPRPEFCCIAAIFVVFFFMLFYLFFIFRYSERLFPRAR